MKNKKYFFGWKNIKWFIKEIVKIFSSEKSYFSKKRIESGVGFIIGEFGMLYYLLTNIKMLSSSDIVLWASVQFIIAGYTVFQIQKEKALTKHTENEKNNEENN